MNDNSVKKILILAANPLDTVRLSLDREVEEIRTTLQLATNRDQFLIDPRGAVRPEKLQEYMYEDPTPYIVHFSGHGVGVATAGDQPLAARKFEPIADNETPPAGLMFEDDHGKSKLVTGKTLANLFSLFKEQVVCVVLNACYSAQQAQEIVKYIPYVVGMNREIGDIAARKFSQGFYRAIWDDRSIEEAFASGMNAIELDGISEALTPVLLSRDLLNLGENGTQGHGNKPEPNSPEADISIVKSNDGFCIVRSQIEKNCYAEILKTGMLIRIKSPDKMGKSLMVSRVLDYVKQQGYQTVIVDLSEVNQDTFLNIDQFLQWLCAYVSYQLKLDLDPVKSWKKILGANFNCTTFFEQNFLSDQAKPLVIAFDNFDCIFDRSNIEIDFCSLLRGWCEKVNINSAWGNLRQIIVYSQESYTIKDINQSPFNIGHLVELDEFKAGELLLLANAYGLGWTSIEIDQLMDMIGGHPYLSQLAFKKIVDREITLKELLKTAATEEGIYKNFLTELLQNLEDNQLVEAMKKVVDSDLPIRLGLKEKFKLDRMGLIKRQGNDVSPRCNLYRWYFKDMLKG